MKYIRQFGIILMVTCLGEAIRYLIPLPVPASVYGLCLMFLLLLCKVIKMEQVQEAARFLIEIMPMMFIPSAVGLIICWNQLKEMLLPLIVITAVSTVLVMIVSGRVTQRIIRRKNNNSDIGTIQNRKGRDNESDCN